MGARKKFAVLDSHCEYVECLARYLEGKQDFPFEVVTFTEHSAYLAYEKKHKVEILLCEEEFALGHASEYNPRVFIVLTEYYASETASGYRAVFKYQSAETLLTEVGSIRNSVLASDKTEESCLKRAKVFGICSPSGGSCKSTLALAMALKQSKKERTLFLSFDPFYNIPGTQKEIKDQSLSDIIYYLKQNPENLHDKIRMVIKRQSCLDYVMGVAHWVDLMDITGSDMKELLEELIYNMSYDSIIIDIGMFSSASMDTLRFCDKIYVPTLGEDESGLEREKAKEWTRQIKFIGGEKLLKRMKVVVVPVDEKLSGDGYSIEAIESGKVGKFAETLGYGEGYAYL